MIAITEQGLPEQGLPEQGRPEVRAVSTQQPVALHPYVLVRGYHIAPRSDSRLHRRVRPVETYRWGGGPDTD